MLLQNKGGRDDETASISEQTFSVRGREILSVNKQRGRLPTFVTLGVKIALAAGRLDQNLFRQRLRCRVVSTWIQRSIRASMGLGSETMEPDDADRLEEFRFSSPPAERVSHCGQGKGVFGTLKQRRHSSTGVSCAARSTWFTLAVRTIRQDKEAQDKYRKREVGKGKRRIRTPSSGRRANRGSALWLPVSLMV